MLQFKGRTEYLDQFVHHGLANYMKALEQQSAEHAALVASSSATASGAPHAVSSGAQYRVSNEHAIDAGTVDDDGLAVPDDANDSATAASVGGAAPAPSSPALSKQRKDFIARALHRIDQSVQRQTERARRE